MKKIFTFLLFVLPFISRAQYLIEDFVYSPGQLTILGGSGGNVSGGNWANNSSTTNPINVVSPGLTYAGYAGSGVGNAVALTTSGEDTYRDWGSPVTSGSVYVSFMINVSAAQATGDYFFGMLPAADASNYVGRTFIKSSGAGFVMGISKFNDASPTYGSTVLNFNQTYLVVVKYTFNTGSTTDDQVTLYVFDSGIPTTEPASAYAGPTASALVDRANLQRIALRQGSASNSATLTVDGFRVSSGWFNAPLPISLVSFNAALNSNAVNVSWATTNEVNTSGFEIQRSANGKEFSTISFVAAKGSLSSNNYALIDEKAIAGTNYYRLKMTDKDGSFKYSQVVTVKTKSIGVGVYPNPVKGELTVQHEAGVKGATVSIVNFEGKEVMRTNVQVGATQTSLDAVKLAPGTYMVIYTNNGERLTKQFVKQ